MKNYLKNSRLLKSQIVQMTAVFVAILLLQCSSPTTPKKIGELGSLIVNPSSGIPGAMLSVSGLTDLNPDTETLSATIGGKTAPIIVGDSGEVLVSIPLFFDDSGFVTVPAEALDLVIIENGVILGEAKKTITVEALPKPTHSLEDITSSLETISAVFDTIISSFNFVPGVEEQYMVAFMTALDSLINSSDSLSLTSTVEGVNADSSLAFVTAILDANGVIEGLMNMAEQLQVISSSTVINSLNDKNTLLNLSSSPAVIPTLLTDQDLARRMQFYVIVKMFGATVISQTGQTYAETVGLLAGVLGIGGVATPYVTTVGAVLTLIDVVVNKIVVGALPAKIDKMTVVFADNTIQLGDTTEASVYILASNIPPYLTVNDLIGLAMTANGLTGSPSAVQSFKDVLKNTVNFFIGVMQATFAAYTAQHPELNLDPNVASLTPPMKWEAYIHDPNLVNCQSLTPSIVTGMNSSPNWQADDNNYGEGRVYVMPATGSQAMMLSLPPGFTYSGGAFGMDMTASETKSVWVKPELALLVDFANTITVGGANVLGLDAGYYDSQGNPHWEPNIDISLTVTDGAADVTNGVTDAQGHFSSIITIDSTAEIVTVHITATGDYDSQAETEVTAQRESGGQIAFICTKDGSVGLWAMNDDGSNLFKLASLDHLTTHPNGINLLSASPDGNYIALWGNVLNDPNAYPYYYSSQLYVCPSSENGILRKVGYGLNEVLLGGGYGFDEQIWFQNRDHTLLYNAFEKERLPNPSVMFAEDASTGSRVGLGPIPYDPISPNPDFPLNVMVSSAVSSSDGSRIAFGSGREGAENISICNADGSNQHIINSNIEGTQSIFWTKDNNYIVAVESVYANSVMLYPASGGIGMEIISSNGAVKGPVTFQNVNAFAYFNITDAPNNIPQGSIKIYSFEDNTIHNVISSVSTWDIALSPDDKNIVYANEAMNGDIFKVNLENGELTQLTFEGIGARKIVWYKKQQ